MYSNSVLTETIVYHSNHPFLNHILVRKTPGAGSRGRQVNHSEQHGEYGSVSAGDIVAQANKTRTNANLDFFICECKPPASTQGGRFRDLSEGGIRVTLDEAYFASAMPVPSTHSQCDRGAVCPLATAGPARSASVSATTV